MVYRAGVRDFKVISFPGFHGMTDHDHRMKRVNKLVERNTYLVITETRIFSCEACSNIILLTN